jgi:general secretion pathway protein K
MKVETRLAQNVEAESELLWLGRSGVELACWYLAEKNRDLAQARFDALSQRWAGGPQGTNEPITGLSLERSELGRGSISVSIVDLERRFNINFAPREILERALDQLGYATLDSATVIDCIADWRDRDDAVQLHGAENDYYLGLPRPHVAKNGPIDHLSELLLVQGVAPEMFWGSGRAGPSPRGASLGRAVVPLHQMGVGSMGLVDLFNTLGGVRININTASREVLQLLPGMDANLADGVVRIRAGLDGMDGTDDDTPFANVGELINVGGMPSQYVQALTRLCAVVSETFEVRVLARVDSYQRVYVAVVKRPPSATTSTALQTINAYWE